ncbi:HAMP domain-containing sensor histidine kinase [Microbacterium sp. 5K110]|jgi:signal transduction histidine kinase|uniref:sensor histidine kinase n=1 Tax=unclassified Microbacterium TaxID=2609290 RepID=UPI0010FD89B4|nr:HAMP domain-containing sensor histidine kinase [Microbacterium sp. 5K110]TLF34222.1 HAMP domain-containing histidine kinase [Microbacterium sp. 5K110]
MSGTLPSEQLGLHRNLLVSQLLLASATVLAIAVTAWGGHVDDVTLFVIGAAMIFCSAALIVLTPRDRVSVWVAVCTPAVDVLAIGILREAAPAAGIGLLWAFPAIWIGSVWGIPGVVAVTVSVAAIMTHQAFDAQQLAVSTLTLPFAISALAAMAHFAARRTRAQRSLLEKQAAELRRSVERARRQEDLVTQVLDAVDFGVIRITPGGELVVSNEAHARLQAPDPWGSSPSPSAFARDGITPIPSEATPLARARAGEVFEGELVWYGMPGEDRRALNVTARRLPGRDDDEVGSVVVSRDVTAEEQALRAREDLVASVSHELRTPLTSIIGYLELALDDTALNAATRDQLEIAERNATRLRELVADILAMSAASRHGVDFALRPAPADVGEIVAAAVTSAAQHASAHGIRIDASGVGPCPGVVDAHRMRQVVDNLLSNAVKYNTRGGAVVVTVDRADGTITISVADDGPGISATDQGRVFDRFFRADAVRGSSVHGSGLGLSISRDIARAHGGDISVRSEPGQGAVFTVRLPQRKG